MTVQEKKQVRKFPLDKGHFITVSNYLAQNPKLEPYLNIYVDGELVKEVEVSDGYVEISIPVTEHEDDIYDVQIKTNCFFNPKNIGMNEDTRDLSVAMYYIGD